MASPLDPDVWSQVEVEEGGSPHPDNLESLAPFKALASCQAARLSATDKGGGSKTGSVRPDQRVGGFRGGGFTRDDRDFSVGKEHEIFSTHFFNRPIRHVMNICTSSLYIKSSVDSVKKLWSYSLKLDRSPISVHRLLARPPNGPVQRPQESTNRRHFQWKGVIKIRLSSHMVFTHACTQSVGMVYTLNYMRRV